MPPTEKKVAFITGAARGIGRAIAMHCAQHGCHVALNDINPDKTRTAAAQARTHRVQTLELVGDVSKKFPVQSMFNEIEDSWGRLDYVINAARVVPNKLLIDMDEWDWRRTLDVNVTGTFIVMQIAARLMRNFGTGGHILNIIRTPAEDATGRGGYRTSQASLGALTKTASREFAAHQIFVHALTIPTPHARDEVVAQAWQTLIQKEIS